MINENTRKNTRGNRNVITSNIIGYSSQKALPAADKHRLAMRYCLNTAESPIKCKYPYSLKAVRVFLVLKICISPGRNNGVTYLTGKAPGIKFIYRGRCSSSARMAGRKWYVTLKYCKRSRAHNARPCDVK